MLVCGIDIGARNVCAVLMQNGAVLSSRVITSGEDGATISRRVVAEALKKTPFLFEDIRYTVATGCGRDSVPFASRRSTEVVCQAKGAFYLHPAVRTVINLGAESSRALRLDNVGRVETFSKNDKCAAGSGLFLETISQVLGVPLEMMDELSIKANGYKEVSSICAVFAESEVISHIHRGIPRDKILAGVHKAVTVKIMELTGMVGLNKDIMLTGGVAKNRAIVRELERITETNIVVPPEPQIVGALGAALIAQAAQVK